MAVSSNLPVTLVSKCGINTVYREIDLQRLETLAPRDIANASETILSFRCAQRIKARRRERIPSEIYSLASI